MVFFGKLFIGMSGRAMLSALSLDLLYLYFSGGWCEPNRVVLYSELVLLSLFSIAGIVWSISYFIRETR